MFGYLTIAVCGFALLALGNVVLGCVMLAGAGLTAAMSGHDEDGDDE
jgi:hypothetical protein